MNLRLLIRIDRITWYLTFVVALMTAGCKLQNPNHPNYGMQHSPPIFNSMPKELSKVVHPAYVIEPPDVLTVEGVHIVPRAPYSLRALDEVHIQSMGELPEMPLSGVYTIAPSGLIDMGPFYGAVRITGDHVLEAKSKIEDHLSEKLKDPSVSLSLARMSPAATVNGEYRVGPDGRIQLGTYGSLIVTGLTVPAAKLAIEDLLSERLEDPEISVSVSAYQSKSFYLVMQGAGQGDMVYKLPSTGNETVLDAIANVQGLDPRSSKKIWVSRPSLHGQPTVMPVDWFALTERGSAETNYQLLPGDRVFLAEDRLVAFDTQLAKIAAPLERMMGVTLLGTGTATRLSGSVLKGGGNPNNSGI